MSSKTFFLAGIAMVVAFGCVERKGANPDASSKSEKDGGMPDGLTVDQSIPSMDVTTLGTGGNVMTGGSTFGPQADATLAGNGGVGGASGFLPDATITATGGGSGSGGIGLDAPVVGSGGVAGTSAATGGRVGSDDALATRDVGLDTPIACDAGYHNCDGTCIAQTAPCAGQCLDGKKYCPTSNRCIRSDGCCSAAECAATGTNTAATCVNDSCGLVCTVSTDSLCGTICTNLSSDPNNCRICGNKCGTSATKCLSGTCVECLSTGDCSGSKVCSSNHCVAPLACGDPLPVVTFPTVYEGSGTAPSPVGGAVTEGVYLLTKYTCYASGLVGVSGGAFQLQNGAFHHKHTSYTTSGSAMTGYEEIGTYAISGAAMAIDVKKCSPVLAAQSLWRYTASPTQIESFTGSAPDICVETYTLQP